MQQSPTACICILCHIIVQIPGILMLKCSGLCHFFFNADVALKLF